MIMTDPIADMLTRIRNALQQKHETVRRKNRISVSEQEVKIKAKCICQYADYIKLSYRH